jgi:glutamine---fructose-6-phosphate transaminase (isomerizing)
MCGILSYIGKKDAVPILLDGLYRLEYRGYDSAGIAVIDQQGVVQSARAVGRVSELSSKLSREQISGTCGIAHTRWATHGAPSIANAHPHTDCTRNVHVVHNGIIENHATIRSALTREGHSFASETDSEVLAHLVERAMRSCGPRHTLEEAVSEALRHVEGTYGIAIISKDHPHKLVAARKGSPLLIGIGDGEFFVSSDSAALVRHTRRIVYLNDNELGIITPEEYEVCNLRRQRVVKPIETLKGSVHDVEKGGFDHFMEKEMHEIPDVIRNATRGRILFQEGTTKLRALDASADKLAHIERIIIPSCGTSYYAGLAGKYLIEELAGISVEVVHASEFRYAMPPMSNKTLVLTISQSGETADTLEAIREAKRKYIPTLAIVNVVGSSIAREAGMGIYNHAGPEIGVASTKAFVSQLTVLLLIAVWLGRQRALSLAEGKHILQELQYLPKKVAHVLSKVTDIQKLAGFYAHYDNFLYIGRKYSWPTALEGALKLKEISYAHAEGYAAGEMKHGPIALITKSFPTIAVVPSDSVYEKSISNIQELKARQGTVLAIATEGNDEILSVADHAFFIPQTLEIFTPILAVLPLQLFAYYIARERRCDIDKPRNLAKSVTVE